MAINFKDIADKAFPAPGALPAKQDLTIGGIVSAILPYVFVLAGLLLFVYLLIGGFGLMMSGGDPKAMDAAKSKITSAVIGFVIIFVSFWLIQILQVIFGLTEIF